MWQDPIVGEVRQIRETHAAQFNFDLRAIYLALKKAEQKNKRKKVAFSPKRITPVPVKETRCCVPGHRSPESPRWHGPARQCCHRLMPSRPYHPGPVE